jgi:hypothetical protein
MWNGTEISNLHFLHFYLQSYPVWNQVLGYLHFNNFFPVLIVLLWPLRCLELKVSVNILCSVSSNNFHSHLLFLIVVLGRGTLCIHKSSYNISNISYLNTPPPSFSFIFSYPLSQSSFNRYHFCIYIHVYTIFALYSLSYTLSPPPPPFHWY